MDLNETKLTNAIAARRLRPATAEEIRAIGAEAGYGSPIGVDRETCCWSWTIWLSTAPTWWPAPTRSTTTIATSTTARDYAADIVADIVAAGEGDACPHCGAPLRAVRGVEVGNIFKLGTKYSEAMGATYLDENGESQPMVMGCYGIGVGPADGQRHRAHHDEHGIKWPITVAPYQVALDQPGHGQERPTSRRPPTISTISCTAAGIEVLYDDRDERAGVKFNDADLLGMPIRLTVGARGLKNGIA